MVTVVGDQGPHVLLLPGGAESVDGFFPGLAEGLVADPGCRVVLWDRPGAGAGATSGPGALADAPEALHDLVRSRDLGPVVVVGQSLGGAVAAMFACEHPDDVAGLVLLDPTPVNDPATCRRTEQNAKVLARVASSDSGSAVVRWLMRRSVAGMLNRHDLEPEARAAILRTLRLDLSRLHAAVDGLGEVAAAFDAARLPRVPSAVVTADRKPNSPVHQAHSRLATALDAPLLMWPGATHSVHLTNPDDVLRATREVVAAVAT